MSLSEPKQREKWSLNPRGCLWANDDNKYGQRLLEKMGWQKGKGLGRNEDGNPECIRVTKRTHNKGLGFSGNKDVWLEHQRDYDLILSSLNESNGVSGNDNVVELKNLEERSNKSKKRIKYNKYIKSKNLSCRSKQDLQCIFGKAEDTVQSEDSCNVVNSDHVLDRLNIEEKVAIKETESFSTVNCGSMEEYFNRMKKLRTEWTTSNTAANCEHDEKIQDVSDIVLEIKPDSLSRTGKIHNKDETVCMNGKSLTVEPTYENGESSEANNDHSSSKNKKKIKKQFIGIPGPSTDIKKIKKRSKKNNTSAADDIVCERKVKHKQELGSVVDTLKNGDNAKNQNEGIIKELEKFESEKTSAVFESGAQFEPESIETTKTKKKNNASKMLVSSTETNSTVHCGNDDKPGESNSYSKVKKKRDSHPKTNKSNEEIDIPDPTIDCEAPIGRIKLKKRKRDDDEQVEEPIAKRSKAKENHYSENYSTESTQIATKESNGFVNYKLVRPSKRFQNKRHNWDNSYRRQPDVLSKMVESLETLYNFKNSNFFDGKGYPYFKK